MSARVSPVGGGPRALLVGMLLACTAALSYPSAARAQGELVLLLVPQSPEPAHVELFHRIEAELRLHSFRPEVVVASPEATSSSLLGAQASAQRAFAAVAIAEQTPYAMLDVWIVDSRTGLTRRYQIAQRAGEEASNVVAVRAVDLLRANRNTAAAPPAAASANATAAPAKPSSGGQQPEAGEPSMATAQEPAATEAATEPATEPTVEATSAPRTTTTPPEAQRPTRQQPRSQGLLDARPITLQLAAEAVALSLARRIGWSGGPSIGAWLTFAERWRLGLLVVAPLWGAVLHTELGDASIRQQLAWLEGGATLLRTRALQLSATAGYGVHFLQAQGRARSPLRSIDDSTWSWTASLAVRADVMISEHWSLGISSRARAFFPPVEVAVYSESARLGLPALEGALGLAFRL